MHDQIKNYSVPLLSQASNEPEYIFWYHNDRLISYDPRFPRYHVEVKRAPDAQSTLTIVGVNSTDIGTIVCSPSNAKPAQTYLHVVTPGESTACV